MKRRNSALFLLLLILALIVIAIFQTPDKNLHIIACDVGQGDGLLISYKNFQIVTDGGPDSRVLECLGNHMPFWDRTIELVISTHSDSDHLTGITEIFKRFKVDQLLIAPIDSGTPLYRLLQSEVGGSIAKVINPTDVQGIGLELIYLDILSPTQTNLDSLNLQNPGNKLSAYKKSGDVNVYSVVYKLSFKNFKGLFLGDITPEISDQLAGLTGMGKVDYIKVPHHGSKNGLTQNLLEKTMPRIGIISVGKDNQWGFPSEEILGMLAKYNVTVLRTDLAGDVVVSTDGEKVWVRK